MKTLKVNLLLLIGVALLFGCAPSFIKGRLSSASYITPKPQATFTIVGSESLTLTEQRIQGLIKKELLALGFKPAVEPEAADLAVAYSYSIGTGHAKVSSRPDFVWGGQKVHSSTSYPRYFQISIIDLPESGKRGEIIFIWQSEIYSTGSSQNMNWLAEQFVPELFKRFGQTTNNELVIKPTMRPLI